MEVYILSGIPGAGKTTWAKKTFRDSRIVSADDFFTDEQGYHFDPTLLRHAHDHCLMSFITAVEAGRKTIIVDNTNIRVWEIAPYYRLAEAFGYKPTIIRFLCDPDVAAKRCVHGVPPEKIREMAQSFDPLPPFWTVRYVSMS